jgi:hypothetical protein
MRLRAGPEHAVAPREENRDWRFYFVIKDDPYIILRDTAPQNKSSFDADFSPKWIDRLSQ